jgi:hypothetical protein
MGSMIERVWSILWGCLLVYIPFCTEAELERQRFFWLPATVLRWIVLLLAIAHLLMAPLLIVDATRIDRNNQARFNGAVAQLNAQLKNAEMQLAQLPPAQLEAIGRRMIQQNGNVDPNEQERGGLDLNVFLETVPPELDVTDPTVVREAVLANLKDNANRTKTQLKTRLTTQQQSLLKQITKWFFATLLSSFLLFLLWRLAWFARRAWFNPLPYFGLRC